MNTNPSRRDLLKQCGFGFGAIALSGLLNEMGYAAPAAADVAASAGMPTPLGSSLAPKVPHFAPKAKRVIHLFMNGGPSQIDTFDPKPALEKYHGKVLKDDQLF